MQLRRGTNATRTGITPLAGEPIYTTDTKLLYIGDGTTAGGNLVSAAPGGSTTQVQANVSGAFTGYSQFIVDNSGVNSAFVQIASPSNTKPALQLTSNGASQTANVLQVVDSSVITFGVTRLGIVTAAGYILSDQGINPQTGTTYTLASTDNGKVVTCSNASAITVTVPSSLPVGFACTIIQLGAGQVTLSASGVTLNGKNGLKTSGQHARIGIVEYTTNVFNVAGDTAV